MKARERAASRRNFYDRARKAEDRGELREAQQKRRVSQRKAMRVLEIRAKEKAARNIQVKLHSVRSLQMGLQLSHILATCYLSFEVGAHYVWFCSVQSGCRRRKTSYIVYTINVVVYKF